MSPSSGRLPAPLARALAARGFTDLTGIQRAALDLAGATGAAEDLALSAPTGSGKTIAFGLLLAPVLLEADGAARAGGPRAIVVAPTRDLAAQVAGELAWLFGGMGARVLCCTGGADRNGERAGLLARPQIVVGSPGRLLDHLASGALGLDDARRLVLDEADELLERGFLTETSALLAALPPGARLVACSATITPRVLRLLGQARGGALPRLVSAAATDRPLAVQATAAPRAMAQGAVAALIRRHRPERALVFCRRRAAVVELSAWLAAAGFRAVGLTGAMSRRERAAALAALRAGLAQICVATDLAARGLDLAPIGLVVHAGLPHGAETLVHRNGRAGRGGSALAVLVVAPAERRRADALARRAGIALDWIEAPGPA